MLRKLFFETKHNHLDSVHLVILIEKYNVGKKSISADFYNFTIF